MAFDQQHPVIQGQCFRFRQPIREFVVSICYYMTSLIEFGSQTNMFVRCSGITFFSHYGQNTELASGDVLFPCFGDVIDMVGQMFMFKRHTGQNSNHA